MCASARLESRRRLRRIALTTPYSETLGRKLLLRMLAIICAELVRSNTERHRNKKTSAVELQRLVRFDIDSESKPEVEIRLSAFLDSGLLASETTEVVQA